MKRSSESGSAIFYIIIAIALIAALSYAVSRGSRTGTQQLSEDQARIAANEIINYGNAVASAVQKLKLRGCADTEISFENSIVSDYTNSNSPTDNSCHVFHTAGGGINWQTPSESWLDKTNSGNSNYQEFFFQNLVRVLGFGDDCAADECVDLTIELPYINIDICNKINEITGTNGTAGTASIVNYTYQFGREFIGTYNFQSAANTSTLGDEEAWLIGKSSGCYIRSYLVPDIYVYYQVILSR